MLFASRFDVLNAQVVRDSVPELGGVGVTEHLGATIPLDLKFKDENGREVKLANYFSKGLNGRPVLLTLAYYRCPMLCTLVLNGVCNGAKELSLVAGRDFDIVTVSIDPREDAALAKEKKERYVEAYGKPEAATGWTFLTGDEKEIQSLAKAVGFGYKYIEERDDFAHPAVSYILMPDGKISRYLYGIEFKPNDLKLALLEAGNGKIGNTIDRIILYCYHYDPNAKGYVVMAGNVMKVGGVMTFIALSLFLASFWVKERFTEDAKTTV